MAALIDTLCPPHPAHVLSCGRGVEALVLAILDGHHALYKVGARLEEPHVWGTLTEHDVQSDEIPNVEPPRSAR